MKVELKDEQRFVLLRLILNLTIAAGRWRTAHRLYEEAGVRIVWYAYPAWFCREIHPVLQQ